MSAQALPHTWLSRRIDPFIAAIGRGISWIWLLLLAAVVVNVFMRYALGEGRIEMEELQWHLYAIGFLMGLSWAVQTDSHIRVDVLHQQWPARRKAWIELYGLLFCLLPFILLVLIYSWPFVVTSYQINEISAAPGGLPYRWLMKAMLPVGFLLLLLATVSRLSRTWRFLFGETT